MTEKKISRQITRYINGELNDHEEDQLWIEFLKNPKNYDLFETELNLTDLYRNKNFSIGTADNPNQVNETKQRYIPWLFPIAIAAVLLLSAVFYIFFYQTNSGPASYAISEIGLNQMLGSEIYRNESPDAAQLDQQINRSLSLALNGDSQQSSEILSELLSDSLTDIQEIRILYNLGILDYNDENFEQSLNHFSNVIELKTPETPAFIYEKSQWYIANIYLKQSLDNKAVQSLKQLASGAGLHASDAEILLSRLDIDQ